MDINDLRAIVTVVSLLTFLGVVWWAYGVKSNKKRFEEAAQVYRTAAGLMEKNPKVDKKDYRDMLERYLESLRFSKKGALAADVEAKLKALK